MGEQVRNAISKAGYTPKVHTYKFYKNKIGLSNALKYLNRKRSVVLVFGGNTFRLNAGIRKVPKFRQTLRKRIRSGRALYVSRSAGTILFGRSVAIASDDKTGFKNVPTRGLCMISRTIRPHTGQKAADAALRKFRRARPKSKAVTLNDKQAIYIRGKKT